MTPMDRPSEFTYPRTRRNRRARERRMLNNLPLAHRLASCRALDSLHEEYLLGQAMVGLVEAVDRFEQAPVDGRFGAYAEPHIISALDRARDEAEVAVAQAVLAAAISSQARAVELAAFLDVPVAALVGGLMDVTARERILRRHQPAHHVA
jgi:DNA-directed RNA polymerase specialized sigma subunit